MSKILIKALKSAILPASLLVVGKFISVFVLISIFNEEFKIANNISSFFSIQLFVESSEIALKINSISNIICLAIIAIPTFYHLLMSTVLLEARRNPRVVVKLTRFNMLKWVTGQESHLIKITIWVVFLWIISGINISNSISGNIYYWIGIVSGVLSLLASLGILGTFEKETAKIYPDDSNRYI